MNLTRFGIWTSYRAIGVDDAAQAARLVRGLGYGAFWLSNYTNNLLQFGFSDRDIADGGGADRLIDAVIPL